MAVIENREKNQIKRARSIERRAFFIGLILVTLAFGALLKPFFGAIFWACVLGIMFQPVQQFWLRKARGRATVAGLLSLFCVLAIGVVPALFVLGAAVSEAVALAQLLQSGEINFSEMLERARAGIPFLQDAAARVGIDLEELKGRAASGAVVVSQWVAGYALQIGQGTLGFFTQLALMLYLTFFLLRDGRRLVALLARYLPLGRERANLLFQKFAEVTRATIRGNFIIAGIQGGLGGMIFFVLGIHGAVLWGIVMTILSLIPVVGAGLIWGPVAIYLFSVGLWGKGLILTLFGAFVIGLVDNFLRPILVGRDTKLPDYMVLFSTLGGLALLGMNGFLLGPVVASLFVAFWQIFGRDFKEKS